MSKIILFNTPDGVKEVLMKEAWAPTALKANASNLLEPTIQKDGTLVGNGTIEDPSGVKISADSPNALTTGTDGGLKVSPAGSYSFTIEADSGTPETINSGNSLKILGEDGIVTEVTSPDTITIRSEFTTSSDLSYFTGAPV